jgi:hypothetical protein
MEKSLHQSGLIYQQEFSLQARPEQTRAFITDPSRVLEYYPLPLEGSVLEPGLSIVCRGLCGSSLIEVINEKRGDDGAQHLEVCVSSALLFRPPYSAERIRQHAFFTMLEDWIIYPQGSGSRVIKRWRDIEKIKMTFLPIAMIVKLTAKTEGGKLINAWDLAAKPQF